MKKPTPKNSEARFEMRELFFSTTDGKGVIQFGNDVFFRVSGYPIESILKAPHSIIRHPDMPRAVFKLFWHVLKSGMPIGAYVKNMSADGSYYWVFAFAFPIEDGYLSIRFKPSSPIFERIREIYIKVKKAEDVSQSIEEEMLLKLIKEEGFQTYDDFMAFAAIEELKSREQIIQSETANSQIALFPVLEKISQTTEATSFELDQSFKRIQAFGSSNAVLKDSMTKIEKSFNELKFLSVNMQAASERLGQKAASLAVVSSEFSQVASQAEKELRSFFTLIKKLSDTMLTATLAVAPLKIQMLMVDFFVKESISKLGKSSDAFAGMNENRASFCRLFASSLDNLSRELKNLKQTLSNLGSDVAVVRELNCGLEVIKQVGAIESSRHEETRITFLFFLKEMKEFTSLLDQTVHIVERETLNLTEHTLQVERTCFRIADQLNVVFDLALKVAEKKVS